jgi:hypothetical protein
MIAIVLNVSIFTSKKTRSCSEFCLEGNTEGMVTYDKDAVYTGHHDLHDAEPAIRARFREKAILLAHGSQNGQIPKLSTMQRLSQVNMIFK